MSKADLLDARWWRGAFLLAETVASRDQAKMLELQFTQHLAVLDYKVEPRQFEHHWTQAQQVFSQLQQTRMPWIEASRESGLRQTIDRMYDNYVQVFGDPDSPEVQSAIDETIEVWRQSRERGQ